MAATFQVIKTNTSYSFILLDGEGNTLLSGGEFAKSEDVEKTIADVRVGSLMSQQIAAGKTPSGEVFFVIKNSQGQIIAKSELFTDQMNFDNTLHQVKDSACVAEITGVMAAEETWH